MKISQAVTFLGDRGLQEEEVVQRVVARFPELTRPPKPADIYRLLKEQYPDADLRRRSDGRVAMLSMTHQSAANRTGRPETKAAARFGQDAEEHAWQQIEQSRQRGGFVAVKVALKDAAAVRPVIATLSGVAPVNVTAAVHPDAAGDRQGSREAPVGIRARRGLRGRIPAGQGRLCAPA